MQTKIVYLEPRGSYKSAMRSDTIWSALCWSIRMIHGNEALEKLIHAYESPTGYESLFYVSSAMPYTWQYGERIPFLPKPFLRVAVNDKNIEEYSSFKKLMRRRKQEDKQEWLTKASFEYHYGGGNAKPNLPPAVPQLVNMPITHNTIDRLKGGTLKIKDKGQLFHTQERFVVSKEKGEKAGIYFLIKGKMDLLEGPLRFLEHYGIGGDRSTGKGSFDIIVDDFNLQEAEDSNYLMTLSLYAPKTEELTHFEAHSDQVYVKTLSRQGWKTLQAKGAQKDPVLYFQEGSVYPPVNGEDIPLGENPIVGQHDSGYSIRQYGHAFSIKINPYKHAN